MSPRKSAHLTVRGKCRLRHGKHAVNRLFAAVYTAAIGTVYGTLPGTAESHVSGEKVLADGSHR